MVLLRRLDYGFNGYQVPPMPRATRSARRRRCFKKGSEDNQICPFDLLAIVAGNLLLEKDGNPSSGDISANKDQSAVASDDAKKEWEDEGKLWKVEAHDCENLARNFFVSKLVSQVHAQISSPKENDNKLGLASPMTNSDCMERVNVEKLVNSRRKDDMGTPNGNVKVAFSSYMECGECKLKDQTMRLIKDEPHRPTKVLNNSESFMCSYDPVFCNKKPAPVSLHSSAKGPLHGNKIIPNTSCPVIQDNVNVVSRDDDDNSSGCTHTSTKKKFLRSAPRIGDRRIRKILASKYWKVAPKLKDAILSKIDGDWRSAYCNRKNSYKCQRSEKLYPLKKRKHFGGYNSLSYSGGGISSESFLDSPQQDSSGDASGPFQKMHKATGPSVVGQNTPFQPRDSHVKLRIKSFRVPELFIEIPESGTIGSLKRAVMEAVTAVLGGGSRVGVLLQGKKVRDDNKTLLQTGISHHNQLDALGFSLEPNHPQPSASLHPGDSLFLLPCEAPRPLSSRYPPTTVAVHPGTCATSPEPHAANSGNLVESNHDSAPSPTDTSVDNSTTNSKALVTVSAMNVEVHTVAPAHQKYKRSEIAQRRIRRPFSVAEVEALVLAVEKLGTGRWRDVKLRAFDDAKHRTYVDLKDKWKTLVHTARISPQQRRGEPVPQELLDRVLTAHAYWSQQQAKHQLKHQLPETCLLL